MHYVMLCQYTYENYINEILLYCNDMIMVWPAGGSTVSKYHTPKEEIWLPNENV